jgi:hypothetical protein
MSKSSQKHKHQIKQAKLALELVDKYLKTILPKLKYEVRLFIYKYPSTKLLIGVTLIKNISVQRSKKLALVISKLIGQIMPVKTTNYNTYYLCWDV